MLKLNLGCGNKKLPGYINVDLDPEMKPDVVADCVEYLTTVPIGTIDKITLFHTLEHISKRKWHHLFAYCSRVLRIGGTIILSFPEYRICVQNYLTNKDNKKEFWEATLYGRQLSSGDYHVAICERDYVSSLLVAFGFEVNYCGVELEPHNSLIRVTKVREFATYVDEVKDLVWSK